jgi:hypothetical protein
VVAAVVKVAVPDTNSETIETTPGFYDLKCEKTPKNHVFTHFSNENRQLTFLAYYGFAVGSSLPKQREEEMIFLQSLTAGTIHFHISPSYGSKILRTKKNQKELSNFKGVYRCKKKFMACISKHASEEKTVIGMFDSAKEAAIAYDRSASILWG